MSGLYLPGMEMPTRCGECPLSLYPHSPCWKNGGALDWENRPDWCPLIELPAEHGRLIDVEPIMKFIQDGLNRGEFGNDVIQVMTEIQYAPAVIPAEVDE